MRYLIENNVIHTTPGYPCMHLGHTTNGTVRHNVCRNGAIRVYGGNGGVPSQGMKVQDNAAPLDVSSCTGCTVDHNLNSVAYTGGTGRCAYATASPKGTASDGTDIGLNDCGSTPPPADQDGDGVPDSSDQCPTVAGAPPTGCPPGPPPPTDHTPVGAFTYSPSSPTVGQTVTFNVSGSTCEDAPCSYRLTDEPGAWPIANGPGPTLSFAFQGEHPASAPVHATLVVTDADGDTSAPVAHNIVVGPAGPSAQTLTLTATADAWISQQTPGTNYGPDAGLRVSGRSGVYEERGMLKFDLSQLPAGATVTAATLKLNVQGYGIAGNGTDAKPLARLITSNAWSDSTVNWSNQPSMYGTPNAPVTPGVAAGSDATANVMGLLPAAPGVLSIGLAEAYGANGREVFYRSREDAAGPAPRLEITYTG